MKEYYKLGYVASPLNAPTKMGIRKNMKKARIYESCLNLITNSRNRAIQGYVPALLDDHIKEEREMGLDMGLKMLEKSDAIILCGKKLTNGMYAELKLAVEQNKRVYILKGNPSSIQFINKIMYKLNKLKVVEISVPNANTILVRREII